jgi:hypothetical protein
MKKSKFTEEQILFALKQAEAGQLVGDVCRQMCNDPPFSAQVRPLKHTP